VNHSLESVKQSLIPLSDRNAWISALHHVPHAFGHTWESCYALHLTTGLDTYLYHLEDNGVHIVCPISEREYKGHIDIFTPYGFSGFISNSEYAPFPQLWEKFALDQNYVCGYFALNSILYNGNISLDGTTSDNWLYVLDLNLSLDQLYGNMSNNRKRQIKKHMVEAITLDKSILKPFFINNFHEFFKDREAGLFSGFSLETLEYLVDLDHVKLIGMLKEGRVEAVSVFAYTEYVGEYLFNISLPDGKAHTVPLLWEGVKLLKELGIPFLNLGGGLKKGDSLSDFKERFGAEKFPLSVLKQVYNKEVFKDLCDNAGVTTQDRYFPPYRNPQVSSN
jgi:hypothetical protein